MQVLEHLVDIVTLIHAQCLSLAVASDSNVKNFLCLSQVLDFEDFSKESFKSCHLSDDSRRHNNVIHIEQQHDVFDLVNKKT